MSTFPYFRITGWTGSPARKAPVLKGSRYSPFDVVPCELSRHLLFLALPGVDGKLRSASA